MEYSPHHRQSRHQPRDSDGEHDDEGVDEAVKGEVAKRGAEGGGVGFHAADPKITESPSGLRRRSRNALAIRSYRTTFTAAARLRHIRLGITMDRAQRSVIFLPSVPSSGPKI